MSPDRHRGDAAPVDDATRSAGRACPHDAETGRQPATAGLPDMLRAATWPLHTEVEKTGVMRRILAGRFDRWLYLALLRNLAAIYDALEPLLARHATHPWLAAIHDPSLARAHALRDDLRVLGADVQAMVLPSTQAYVDRLRVLGVEAPKLLVAHAYVRYLGDLSGGQVLRRIVRRTLELSGSDGTRFYEFGDDASVAARARAFRQGLASIPADHAAALELIGEAQRAFALHAALFRELDPDPAGKRPMDTTVPPRPPG